MDSTSRQDARNLREEFEEYRLFRLREAGEEISRHAGGCHLKFRQQVPPTAGKVDLADATIGRHGPSLDEPLTLELRDHTRHAAAVEIHPPRKLGRRAALMPPDRHQCAPLRGCDAVGRKAGIQLPTHTSVSTVEVVANALGQVVAGQLKTPFAAKRSRTMAARRGAL